MAILIGVDEAGYGPNLGPLVVIATVWQVADRIRHEDLYSAAAEQIRADAPAEDDPRLWVADSKRVYRPRGPIGVLERSVLTMLPDRFLPIPCRLSHFWKRLDQTRAIDADRIPWFRAAEVVLPNEFTTNDGSRSRKAVREGLLRVNIRLLEVAGAVIVARRFNALLEREGNKGSVLTRVTLRLVRELTSRFRDQPIDIVCDRHGGRQHYAAVLQDAFGDRPILARQEESQVSHYQIGTSRRDPQIRFMVRSESLLATALASMTAKYMRELTMRAFNQFWLLHLPQLKPTAGYPVDARRFRRDISAKMRELRIPAEMLWRER